MRIASTLFIVSIAAVLAAGCTEEDAQRPRADSGSSSHDDAGCVSELQVTIVVYEHVCLGGGTIECQGAAVDTIEEHDPAVCGALLTCSEPDRDTRYWYRWHPVPGPCEFCTVVEGTRRCTAVTPACGVTTIEHIAAGSPEAGPVTPPGSCDDAGTDQ